MPIANGTATLMDIDLTRRNQKPRPLSNAERSQLDEFIDAIHYSGRYVQPLSEHLQLRNTPD